MSSPSGNTIGFIGSGNMAEAIVRGLLRAKLYQSAAIGMTDVRGERVAELHASLGVTPAASNRELLARAGTIVLAVKPQNLPELLAELSGALAPRHLVLSILAGVRCETIESGLAYAGCPRPRVVRAMPNTPALVLEGATAICAGTHATPADLLSAKAIFDATGRTEIVDAAMMDAITGLTGSGPAYVFRLVEALIEAGVAEGLPRATAETLVKQMVYGSALMARDSEHDAAELRRRVTSPGGTTAAGLAAMEERDFAGVIRATIAAATRRSRELGGG